MKRVVPRLLISIALCFVAIFVLESVAIDYYVSPRAEAEFIAKFNIDEIEGEVRKPFVAEFHLFSESDLQPGCFSCLTETALSRVKVAFLVLYPSPQKRELYWIVPKCDEIARCVFNEKYDLSLVPETQETLSTLADGFSNDSNCEYSQILIYEVQHCTSTRAYLGVVESVSHNLSVDRPHIWRLFIPPGPGLVTTVYRAALDYVPGTCAVTRRGNLVPSNQGGCT